MPTKEAIRIAGFHNHVTFLKVIRARKIEARRGRKNQKVYSRAKMLELARDREAAEKRRAPKQDPLNEPLRSGDIHAAAFEMLDGGASPVEVVRQLKIPAELAEELFKSWVKLNQMNLQVREPQLTPPPVTAAPLPLVPARVEVVGGLDLPPIASMPAREREADMDLDVFDDELRRRG